MAWVDGAQQSKTKDEMGGGGVSGTKFLTQEGI